MDLQMTATGQDDLAKFRIEIPGYCHACGQEVNVAVSYGSLLLKKSLGPIELKSTVIGTPQNKMLKSIGITCGCYAKFHRQVAHIRDKQKSRKSG